MNPSPPRDIAAIILDGTAIDRAMAAAHRRVLEHHRQLGIPLVIWRGGKVVEVAPESVNLPPDPDAGDAGNNSAQRPTVAEIRKRLERLRP